MMQAQTGKRREWRSFWQTKSKKQLLLLIVGLTLGILLLLIGNGSFTKTSTAPQLQEESSTEQELYRAELEKRIETLCESVKGVSAAKAMVSLGSGYTTVYVPDANGGPASVGNGSSEAALQQTVLPPTVIGVGVVCKGGADPQIQQQLTELLSTTLGISSHKVCIVGK